MATPLIDNTPEPGDAQCHVASATMQLSQRDLAFDGSFAGGVSCAFIPTGDIVLGAAVTDGSVNGRLVRFKLGTWDHWGFVRENEMSGSAVIDAVVDGAPRKLTAQWSATRQ